MSHTPGPWTIGEPDEDGDGVTIESQQGPVAFRVIDCSANLIAAAPELLDALKRCVFALNVKAKFKCGDTDSYAIAALADAAIRKAEGRGK
jgi:hypothetical protein